jgi:hypothetical protein
VSEERTCAIVQHYYSVITIFDKDGIWDGIDNGLSLADCPGKFHKVAIAPASENSNIRSVEEGSHPFTA